MCGIFSILASTLLYSPDVNSVLRKLESFGMTLVVFKLAGTAGELTAIVGLYSDAKKVP